MNKDFTTSFTVNKTPHEVFEAIITPQKWWSTVAITGKSQAVGDVFQYTYQDRHLTTQQVTELIPDKKVVWHVTKAYLKYIKDTSEWQGTDIVFEITEEAGATTLTFTHVGLDPEQECYNICSVGWSTLINSNLRNFIMTGVAQPNPAEIE